MDLESLDWDRLHVFFDSEVKQSNWAIFIFQIDSTNTSPYARYMKVQKATNAYSLASQRAPPYGYTASRRRPPAIPVRSRVVTGQTSRPQPALVTGHHLLTGMSIVVVKTKGLLIICTALLVTTQRVLKVVPCTEKKANKQRNKKKTTVFNLLWSPLSIGKYFRV